MGIYAIHLYIVAAFSFGKRIGQCVFAHLEIACQGSIRNCIYSIHSDSRGKIDPDFDIVTRFEFVRITDHEVVFIPRHDRVVNRGIIGLVCTVYFYLDMAAAKVRDKSVYRISRDGRRTVYRQIKVFVTIRISRRAFYFSPPME